MPSAKQQPSNVKHDGAIRPNVWVLTFGPPCIMHLVYDFLSLTASLLLKGQVINGARNVSA